METLAQGRNVGDRRVASEIAGQVLPLIRDLPKPEEREFFEQRLARFLHIDERAFIGSGSRAQPVQRPRTRTGQAAQRAESAVAPLPAAITVSSSQRVESYIIAVLFRKPELLYRLDRLLQQYDLTPLAPEDFDYTDHQLLFGLIHEAVEQDETEHHAYVVEATPESLRGLSRDLLAQTEKLDPLEDKLMEELLRGVIKLRRVAAGENLNHLRFLQEEAQQTGDLRAGSYQELARQNTRLLLSLDQAYHKISLRRLQ